MEHSTILGAEVVLPLLLYCLIIYILYPQALTVIPYYVDPAKRRQSDQPAVGVLYGRLHELLSPTMARSLALGSPVCGIRITTDGEMPSHPVLRPKLFGAPTGLSAKAD
ncbi:hypothetical protein PG997_008721 [Apiospora hydei]|uniref:Uncharacterized protein n=1 Tax=Apiospora hydei TaxID=1337664 RepID=A0ABR1WBT9_9PEZI